MSSLVRCWFDNTKYEIQQDKKYLAHWLVAGIQQAAIIIKYKIQKHKTTKYRNTCSLVGCWSTIGNCQNKRAEQEMQNTKTQKFPNTCSLFGCRSTIGGRHHQRAKQGRSRLLLSLHTNYNGTNGIWEKQNTNTKHKIQ